MKEMVVPEVRRQESCFYFRIFKSEGNAAAMILQEASKIGGKVEEGKRDEDYLQTGNLASMFAMEWIQLKAVPMTGGDHNKLGEWIKSITEGGHGEIWTQNRESWNKHDKAPCLTL